MPLHIDYTNMFVPAVEGGITREEWERARERFRAAHAAVAARRRSGEVGFVDLPNDNALLEQSTALARRAREARFADVVVLGIGGSALGPIALRTALRPYGWNALDEASRDGWPRLHVLDNVDPVTIAAVLGRLNLAKSLFIVTSKSGGTAETMAQYLVVRGRLEDAKLPVARHIAFVTDPKKGALRPIADRDGIPALDVPPNVGGRFSVLTPVGVLPAALIGIDVEGLLRGAGEIAGRCETGDLRQNPAGVFATAQWLSDTSHGRRIHVLMPYSDPLRDFAAWFVQLWAESLGKIAPNGTHVGPTPLAALGATDQHSQVQLFMEGPADKTIAFVATNEMRTDIGIPSLHDDVSDLAYLGGHKMSELLEIERRATAGALAKRGRPNLTIELERVDAASVGALIMMLEIATSYAGELYGINAFDQPGVELGKRFTYAMLGRSGFDDARKEWDALPKSDSQLTVHG